MSIRNTQSFQVSKILRVAFVVVSTLGIYLLAGMSPSLERFSQSPHELQFSDASPSGLAIVPASCNSDPHFAGECDIANPTITGYSCNALGTSVTVSFSMDRASGLNPAVQYAARGDMNPSSYSGICGSMNAGDYCDDAIGVNATSFTFTTTPGSPYAVWMHAINSAGGWSSGSNTINFTCSGPASPSASMSSSLGTTMTVGQTTSISASFTPGSGDSMTGTWITNAAFTTLTTGVANPPAYSFTPSAAGTYTFYARGTSSAYPSIASYASITITVDPIPAPTATMSSSLGATMTVGQTTSISASFTPGSGDSMTGTRITNALGTILTSGFANPPAYSFTPSAAGTYTFNARGTSSAYPTLTTYSSITITVNPAPVPTATMSSSLGATMTVGQTTSISASFTPGSGDSMTGTRITNSALTMLTSGVANPPAYSFTPASAGTYTFYARGTSSAYPTLTTYSSITITVNPVPPSCSMSLSPSSINRGQSSTLSWTLGANTTAIYINVIGWVYTNGSTVVSPLSTTAYSGTAYDPSYTVTAGCTGTQTLTVNVPPAPTATLTSNVGTTVNTGTSVTLTAVFTPGSGDSMTSTNIANAAKTNLLTAGSALTRTYTFTPTAAGTYFFYARGTSSAYPTVADYATIAITVNSIPPSCTISLSPNPINRGQSSTLSWTLGPNTDHLWISGVGYVYGNGSSSVAPTVTTSYAGTAYDDTWETNSAACTGTQTLTVNVPPAPTVSFTSSLGTSMVVGQTTSISASFTPGSGDSMTGTRITNSLGTILTSGIANPPAYSFTPGAAGTYTFNARGTSSAYPTLSTYGTLNITVGTVPPPTATITSSAGSTFNVNSPTTFTATFVPNVSDSMTSTNIANSSNVNQLTAGSALTRTFTFTPTAAGIYTFYARGSSTRYPSATNYSSITVTAQACAPLYSCNGTTIQYTDPTCTTANVVTCIAPAMCVPGQSTCSNPPVSINALDASPSIVQPGAQSTLTWSVSNAASCTVSGNGQTFTGLSGSQVVTLNQSAIFTLTCNALSGVTPSTVSDSTTILVTPVYEER